MPEDNLDVQQGSEGDEPVLPVPEVSPGPADVSSEAPGIDVEAFADKVLERIDSVLDDKVDARVKSIKDRRMAKLAKADEILEFVELAGGDKEKIRDALNQSELLGRLDAIEERLGSGSAGGSAPARDIQKEAAEILTEADISYDDPSIAEWAAKSFASETQAITALRSVVTKRHKNLNIGPAATVGAAGRPAASGDSYAELGEQLAGLRGKFDEESQKSRKEIQSKMAELEKEISFVETGTDAFG